MEEEKFIKILTDKVKEINLEIDNYMAHKFYKFTNILLDWNEKINLTSITDINDVILKHYVDSLTINKYIDKSVKILDVGTGAGFPGIPLKIINEDKKFVLMDSLNKRVNFLEKVKEGLDLKNIEIIHSRAEDLGKNLNYREKFEVTVSRAVASLNVLLEYMLPLVKVDGICICMKGPNIYKEIEEAKNALEILGGKIEKIEKINLPGTDMERIIIIIRKINKTPNKYPRKAGIPSKTPII